MTTELPIQLGIIDRHCSFVLMSKLLLDFCCRRACINYLR